MNPGPEYPCGSCSSEVSDDDWAVDSDNCYKWFDIQCQEIGNDTYSALSNGNFLHVELYSMRLYKLLAQLKVHITDVRQ